MDYQLTRERLVDITRKEEGGRFLRSAEMLIGDKTEGLDHAGLRSVLLSGQGEVLIDDAGFYFGTNFEGICDYNMLRFSGNSSTLKVGEEGSPERQETGRLVQELVEGSNPPIKVSVP